MIDNHRENLSAGIDGELSSDALRFLLRRLEHDDALRQAWSRYGLIGDGLRGKLPLMASAGFAERVMQAVEKEGTSSKHASSPWLRWSAGGLIAASVAVVALMVNRPAGNAADRVSGQVAAAVNVASHAAANPSMVSSGGVPARVPSWLSSNNDISLLSEQAAATRFLPFDGKVTAPVSSPYPLVGASHRAATPADGSYLMLDSRQAAPAAARTKNQ